MTDGGTHFIHGAFRKMLAKYDVNHRISSPYHPQSSGQVELSNKELKLILQKTVHRSRKNWSKKVDDALWAYITTYKNPEGFDHRITQISFVSVSSCFSDRSRAP